MGGEGTGASELADEGTEWRQPEAIRSLSTPHHTVTLMMVTIITRRASSRVHAGGKWADLCPGAEHR